MRRILNTLKIMAMLLFALSVQACPGSTTPQPESVRATEPAVEVIADQKIQLRLDPARTTIQPGEEIRIIASDEWVNLSWEIASVHGNLASEGSLTNEAEQVARYVAPFEQKDGQVSVLVVGETKSGRGQNSITFTIQPVTRLSIYESGAFNDKRVQEAFFIAVDWREASESVFGEGIPVKAFVHRDPLYDDARDLDYDPEIGEMLNAEAGYLAGDLQISLLYPGGDDELAMMAEITADYLSKIGAEVYPTAIPQNEILAVAAQSAAAGETLAVLSR